MKEWITDPRALDTIAALGLQPGDEVLLRSYGPHIRDGCEYEGLTARVLPSRDNIIGTVNGAWCKNTPILAIADVVTVGPRYVCRAVIKGWRRDEAGEDRLGAR